ncbi:MAG: PAS domain S-box protein, partial [Chloroflexi bacterium]|nr:PAS domain S-box protein [Chloroflexota bacterium]
LGLHRKVLRKDGTIRLAEISTFPLRGGDGKITGFRGIGWDITERQRAGEVLRIQRDMAIEMGTITSLDEALKLCLKAAITIAQLDSGGIYLIDSATGALDLAHHEGLSPEFVKLVSHYEPDAPNARLVAEGKPVYLTVKQFDPVTAERMIRESLRVLAVVPILHEGLAIACLNVASHTLEDVPANARSALEIIAGQIGGTIARVQAREMLYASEERYRLLVETANEAIIVAQDGMLKFANPRTSELTGYSNQELLSMPFAQLIHPDDRDMVVERHLKRLAGEVPPEVYPFRYVAKDGSVGWVDINAVRIEWEGRPATLNFLTDITERKKAEEERQKLEIKAQVSSRLASVGQMTAGVAHEINNPLTAVTGYAQLLLDREDVPPDVRKDLAAINDGARRVAGIVQRLLAFSRQTKPERKQVNINELIDGTLVLRAYHLKTNNIKVATSLAPDLPQTVADPGQIQQVILNLIVNAEKEMKLAHGKGKLTISTEKSDGTIKICVKDDGLGIKPEVIDKIFDPFFTTREVGEGAGLGLSLCYGIVAEHNGKIYAESKPGKGATFIVELPIVTEIETSDAPEPAADEPERVGKARILVVDDEQVIRDIAKRILTGEGYKVDTVDNATDALKMIEGKRYNLLLLDVKMPGMSGPELYRRLQKIAKSLAKRVVFVTGDVMSADTDRFLAETGVAHVAKPFDAAQLKKEVKRVLSEGQ